MSLRIVLVTVPERETGRKLAKVLLESKLAACVNLVPGVESHYWWKDKLETAEEVLLLIKTSSELFGQLQEVVKEHHPYECPEIVALEPQDMALGYRKWWQGLLD
jgi:periplasmic divalent cation tolerance protein